MANQKQKNNQGILKFIPQSENLEIVIQKNGVVRIKRQTSKKTKKRQ